MPEYWISYINMQHTFTLVKWGKREKGEKHGEVLETDPINFHAYYSLSGPQRLKSKAYVSESICSPHNEGLYWELQH